MHIISWIYLLKKGVCRWRFFNFWTWFVWAVCSSMDYSLVVIFSFLFLPLVQLIPLRCSWMDYIFGVIFPCCYLGLVYPNEVFSDGLHLAVIFSVTWIWFIQVRCFWIDYILAVIFSYCYQSLVYPNEVFLNGLHLGCHLSLLLPKSDLSKWGVLEWILLLPKSGLSKWGVLERILLLPKSGLSKWGVLEWITSWLSSFLLTITKVWFIQMRCSWMDYILAVIFFLLLPKSGLFKWDVLEWITSWLSSFFYYYQSLVYPNEVFLNGFYCYQSLVYSDEVFLNGLHLGRHLFLLLPKSGLSNELLRD